MTKPWASKREREIGNEKDPKTFSEIGLLFPFLVISAEFFSRIVTDS